MLTKDILYCSVLWSTAQRLYISFLHLPYLGSRACSNIFCLSKISRTLHNSQRNIIINHPQYKASVNHEMAVPTHGNIKEVHGRQILVCENSNHWNNCTGLSVWCTRL